MKRNIIVRAAKAIWGAMKGVGGAVWSGIKWVGSKIGGLFGIKKAAEVAG